MDANIGAVFGAMDVVRVGTGKAAIVWVTAGLPAVVRIPVVSAVVFSDECFDIFADSCVIRLLVYFPEADGLIEYLHIFFFSTCLIDFEETV